MRADYTIDLDPCWCDSTGLADGSSLELKVEPGGNLDLLRWMVEMSREGQLLSILNGAMQAERGCPHDSAEDNNPVREHITAKPWLCPHCFKSFDEDPRER